MPPHENHLPALAQGALASLKACGPLPQVYQTQALLSRMTQPAAFIHFPIPWRDDQGQFRIQQGYVVYYVNLHSAPCTLCLQPGLTGEDALAQGFGALLENALAGQIGSCFIGADCDVTALSDGESMSFCQHWAGCLCRLCPQPPALAQAGTHLPDREQGYLRWQLEMLTGQSYQPQKTVLLPSQAAGYGLCYFVQAALRAAGRSGLNGKRILIAGSGPAAVYAAQKAIQQGGYVTALGDKTGYIAGPRLPLQTLLSLLRAPLASLPSTIYHPEPEGLWDTEADVVLLCGSGPAPNIAQAQRLAAHGLEAVGEGAAGTCPQEFQTLWESQSILFCPGLAAGAGAALLQNAGPSRSAWEADKRLRNAMGKLLQTLENVQAPSLTHAAHITALERLAEALQANGI